MLLKVGLFLTVAFLVSFLSPSLLLAQSGARTPAPVVSTTVTIRAWGQPANGNPIIRLYDEGRYLQQYVITATSKSSAQNLTYTFPAGQTFRGKPIVRFVNDFYRPSLDRNVFIDYIMINGIRYETEDSRTYSVGSWTRADGCNEGYKQQEVLACNGFFRYDQYGQVSQSTSSASTPRRTPIPTPIPTTRPRVSTPAPRTVTSIKANGKILSLTGGGTKIPLLQRGILILEIIYSTGQKRNLVVKFDLPSTSASVPRRGGSGDLWADQVIGKRDFGEISAREVVPYKLFSPGGVVVDRRGVIPGRAYVWDSGNNRILGIDLGKCYQQKQASQDNPCTADIVIGQPEGSDFGACNQDASLSSYPFRKRASASTLCGTWEGTYTTVEDKSFVSMFTDAQGNLYVPDFNNNRVLKYNNPFTTDTVADEVWGQRDFAGNECNITGNVINNFFPDPTASSLCFRNIFEAGAGVTLDKAGNLWVADGGNNRVIRFPKNTSGSISKTADLVLGQANFTSQRAGDAPNQMKAPAAIRSDGLRLYVADSGNGRVLRFDPPFASGMHARKVIGQAAEEPRMNLPLGLEIDPFGRGLLVLDHRMEAVIQLWSFDGDYIQSVIAGRGTLSHAAGGSLGIDAQNNILASTYVYGNDVYRLSPQADGKYLWDKNLFSPPWGYNLTSGKRLEHPSWVGVGIAGDQLIVSDGRLLFWNNLNSLRNGKPADGFIGSSITDIPNPGFGQIKTDANQRVWVGKKTQILIYQSPLSQLRNKPIKTIASSIPVLGGGRVRLIDVAGIAPSSSGNFLWVSEPGNHRVMRIRNPLTDPLVDVILGQTSLVNNTTPDDGFLPSTTDPDHPNLCNRGLIFPPNQNSGRPPSEDAGLDMLCFPGAISLDKQGNLFVSDHMIESAGNWRLLMFSADLFPTNPSNIIFALPATKEFPRFAGDSNPNDHKTFEPAFDSTNRMVVGYNPYGGSRFVGFYNDPTRKNPDNPSDPQFARPDGHLKDFYGWPVAITFDDRDDLYVYDANRGQVRIYYKPFGGN